ncbi:MAG: hypothetical protein HYV03_07920, partial [Deltaproteobacteria bacterium]|nr:hypothetical protein [Deltaproteobacteria bacterium]
LTWVGYDDNSVVNLRGARAALPIWVDFMKRTVGDSRQEFPPPPSVVLVKIDPETGMVWTKHCPQEAFAPFVEGAEPDRRCPLHSQAPVPGRTTQVRY